MALFTKKRRRGAFRAGLASLVASAAIVPDASAAPRAKAAGEIKVVALFGTTDMNNGIGHELKVRSIFESKRDWRVTAVRGSKYFTPALISDADLLIICRDNSADPIDIFTDGSGVSDTVVEGTQFWTDTNIDAVIDNVRNRGMGLLALHNTIMSGSLKFEDFLDVKPLKKHMFEPLWAKKLNREHPVTKGVGKFIISRDEQYGVMIKSPTTATLFETTSVHEKRQVVSGWALERGRGRIVGLLPGSTVHAYNAPEYRNIVWRAAHWAMNRKIESYPEADNTLYD